MQISKHSNFNLNKKMEIICNYMYYEYNIYINACKYISYILYINIYFMSYKNKIERRLRREIFGSISFL